MVDLYEVLQVHPRADAEVIRAAFRALARKHHPDAGGDPQRMMALADAWRVLGDRRARARYDAARAVELAVEANRSATAAPRPTQPVAPTPAAPVAPAEPAPDEPLRAPSRTSADGTVLDFGRYTGWSLRELALRDPDYLEWLKRTSIGRRLASEIDTHLTAIESARPVATATRRAPVSRFRRPIFGRA